MIDMTLAADGLNTSAVESSYECYGHIAIKEIYAGTFASTILSTLMIDMIEAADGLHTAAVESNSEWYCLIDNGVICSHICLSDTRSLLNLQR
jgi:ribosomal silencing factor RsfS